MNDKLKSGAQEPQMSREQLVRAHFEAYRDLMWADAMEPRLKGYDLNSDAMKPYREAWNAFVKERDWDWWWDETRRISNEELKAEIGDCLKELKSREMRQSGRDQATNGGRTFHDIVNRAGDGERSTAEPTLTKGRKM
jgi:hypothetical protein